MENQYTDAFKICHLDIAGIILTINSNKIDIPTILSPVYRSFMVTGNIRNNYLLTLVQNDGIIDCPLSDDIHPKVVSFINEIMLIFRSGRVQFELNSNSGIFNTMSNEPLVEIEYCLRILFSYFV